MAAAEQSFAVAIVISNNGGTMLSDTGEDVAATYNPPLRIENVVIETRCGPESTVLELLSLPEVSQPPNLPGLPSAMGVVKSSNPTCPVISHELVTGSQFTIQQDGSNFAVILNADSNKVDFNNGLFDDLVFAYTVETVSKGGASLGSSATMTLTKVCVAELVDSFSPSWQVEFPESGFDPQTFPTARSEYVTLPVSDSTDYQCS
jgi:hypothetical protein